MLGNDGEVRVFKQTLGGSGGPFTFFVDGPGNNSATAEGSTESPGTPVLVGNFQFGNGNYTITETGLPDGWVLTDATCVSASQIETLVSLANNQVSVVVNGNSPLATCTFTNTFQAFTPTPTSTVTPTPTDTPLANGGVLVTTRRWWQRWTVHLLVDGPGDNSATLQGSTYAPLNPVLAGNAQFGYGTYTITETDVPDSDAAAQAPGP